MINKCLYCYQSLLESEKDFHAKCSKKFFGQDIAPELPYSEDKMEELAEQVIKSQTAVTGVQPKLSLHLASADKPNLTKRFSIVGLWVGYILKHPSPHYLRFPEVEDLTMHLANIS